MVSEIFKIFLVLSILQMATPAPICEDDLCIVNSQDDLVTALKNEVSGIAINKTLNLSATIEITKDIAIGLFNSITFSHQSDGFLISADVEIVTTIPALELFPILKNYSSIIHFSDEVTISGSDIAFNSNGGSFEMNCTGNKVTIKNNRIAFNFTDDALTIIGNIDITSTEYAIFAYQSSVSITADGTIQSAIPIYIETEGLTLGGLTTKLSIKSTGEKSIAIDALNYAALYFIGMPDETEEEEETDEVEVLPYGDIEIKGGINLVISNLNMYSYDRKFSIENENGDGITSSGSYINIFNSKVTIKGNPEAINIKTVDTSSALKASESPYISFFMVNDIKFSSDSAATIYKFTELGEEEGLKINPYETTVEENQCFAANSMSFKIKDSQIRASPLIISEDGYGDISQRQRKKIGSFDNITIFDTEYIKNFATVGSKGNFYDAEIKYIAINSGESFSPSLICQEGICIASSQDDLECAFIENSIFGIAINKDLTLTGTFEINDGIAIGLFNSITFSHQSDGFLISGSLDIVTKIPALEVFPILKNYSSMLHFSDEVTISGSDTAFKVEGGYIMINCTGNKVTIKNNRIGFDLSDFGRLYIFGNIDFTSSENVIFRNRSLVVVKADGTIQSAIPVYAEGERNLTLSGLKNKLLIKSTGKESIAIEAIDVNVNLFSLPEEKAEKIYTRIYVGFGDIEIKGAINLVDSYLNISAIDKKITIENEIGDGIISSGSYIEILLGKITIKGNPEAINIKSKERSRNSEAYNENSYISITMVKDIKFSSDSATTIYKFGENANYTDESGITLYPYRISYEDSDCFVKNSMSFIVKDTQVRAVQRINAKNFACEEFSQRQGDKIGSFDNITIFDIPNKTGYLTVGSKGDFYDAEVKYIAINSGASFEDEEGHKSTSAAVIAVVVIVCVIVVALIVFLIMRKIKKKSAVDKLEDLAVSFKE